MSAVQGTATAQLSELQRLERLEKPGRLPNSLPAKRIEVCPEVFQPREGLTEYHVQALAKAIRQVGELEAILVIQLGPRTFVVDGHHRLEAYKAAKWKKSIPVTYFDGSLEDARLAAGENNSRAKLPMSGIERQDFAWKLVSLGSSYSKQQITRAAGVSDGSVGNMRRVAKKLGSGAADYSSWYRARTAAQGGDPAEWSDDDRATWQEEQAQRLTERLAKAWGQRGLQHPEIAAMALERYYGRRLRDLGEHLAGHMPNLEDDEEGHPDF